MSPFLFVVSSATSYRLHRLFIQYCVTQGHSVALVYDNPRDELYAQIEQDCAGWNASLYSLDDSVVESAIPSLSKLRMPRPFRAWLFSHLAPAKDNIYTRILGARLAAAQSLLTVVKPKAVIVAEDGISGPAALMAATRNLNIPVVDLPYEDGTRADLDNALDEKIKVEPLLRPEGRLGSILRFFAPFWVKKGRHAGTIIFPQEYIAAREALGMTLRDAWIVHGGFADRLLAESPQMIKLYLSEGIPRQKLILTGTPYCDVMHESLAADSAARAAFCRAQFIQKDKIRILVSWPTSYHDSRAEHCEFPTYEEMSITILSWLQALPGCSLTVSLHPAVREPIKDMLVNAGINLSQEYILNLIPKNDIYISYFSSTQRWALACGKLVVNYDAYGVNLGVYDDAPGFVKTRKFHQFQMEIKRLMQKSEFDALATKQVAVASEWGVVDGQSMSRILTSLLTLK